MDPQSKDLGFAQFNCFGTILYELLIAGLTDQVYQSDAYKTLPGFLVNMGKRTFISGDIKRPNFEANKDNSREQRT